MLRKSPGLLALLLVGAGSLAPSISAQPIGVIDQPTQGQRVSGVVKVTGWVLDFNAIDRVELLVDGTFANRADTNLPRADVLEVFPTYANSSTPNPGFVTSFLASR
ncbi:MAG TPA: Ig-like domain-containing protein, partial [Thermoanaerobaculia bacterium]|nr:Ig-like domain-containing protein [Thermoanaerobaculia bacterium]